MSNAHANTSPHLVAQIAKAELLVAEQFATWGLTDPDQRATYLLRRLRTELDWGPPRTAADEPAPPARGSYSTREGRAAARALFEQTLAAKNAAPSTS